MNNSMDEDIVENKAVIVGKFEKAHPRAILGLWSFDFGGQIGVLSVAHDSAKLWALSCDRKNKTASIDFQMLCDEWRNAVQAVEVSLDGKYIVVVGIDSVVREIRMENSMDTITKDNPYMDAVHAAVRPDKTAYLTVCYSTGTLNEGTGEKVFRKEVLQNVKNISVLKYSYDGKYVAIGQLDGGIDLLTTETLKTFHKYEAHSMRIRKLAFLPDNERFLSGCDDRLIKMHSLVDFSNEVDPTRSTKCLRVYSAHDAPITGLTIDPKSGGTRFASSSMSGQIFIWHIELTAPIIRVANDHTSTICALTFTTNGQNLLSGGDDCLIEIYDVPGYEEETPKPAFNYQAEAAKKAVQPESPAHQLESQYSDSQNSQQQSQEHSQSQQQDSQQSAEAGTTADASGYQEYRPYAEPRTPPPDDDDDDLGDFVYGSTQQQEEEEQQQQQQQNYQSNQNYAPTSDYNQEHH